VSGITRKVQDKLSNTQKKAHMKGAMKWLPYISTSFLNKMCDILKSGIYTEKRFKEVHLNACAKALFEHYGAKVSHTQV
jgi:hypothetical protein